MSGDLFDFAKFALPALASLITLVYWLSSKFESQSSSTKLLTQKSEDGQKATEALISSVKDNILIQISQLSDKQTEQSRQNDRRFDEVAHRLESIEVKHSSFEREGAIVIHNACQATKEAQKAVTDANALAEKLRKRMAKSALPRKPNTLASRKVSEQP